MRKIKSFKEWLIEQGKYQPLPPKVRTAEQQLAHDKLVSQMMEMLVNQKTSH